MADKADRDFELAMTVLKDNQSYLADHKGRRWEVLKWGVSLNLAFATASAFKTERSEFLSFFLFVVGMAMSLTSIALIVHLNRRMTRTRERAKRVAIWLEHNGLDVEGIMGEKPVNFYPLGEKHDATEMWIATIVLLLIPFLSLIRVLIGT
jgi:hypothetical protein